MGFYFLGRASFNISWLHIFCSFHNKNSSSVQLNRSMVHLTPLSRQPSWLELMPFCPNLSVQVPLPNHTVVNLGKKPGNIRTQQLASLVLHVTARYPGETTWISVPLCKTLGNITWTHMSWCLRVCEGKNVDANTWNLCYFASGPIHWEATSKKSGEKKKKKSVFPYCKIKPYWQVKIETQDNLGVSFLHKAISLFFWHSIYTYISFTYSALTSQTTLYNQ